MIHTTCTRLIIYGTPALFRVCGNFGNVVGNSSRSDEIDGWKHVVKGIGYFVILQTFLPETHSSSSDFLLEVLLLVTHHSFHFLSILKSQAFPFLDDMPEFIGALRLLGIPQEILDLPPLHPEADDLHFDTSSILL